MINFWKKNSGGDAADLDAVYAPISGTIVPLEQVPDPVFAGKMLGDGVAILPSSGEVVSPFDGEVVSLFPTGHAVGLVSVTSVECLIHIGIDTVELSGSGFSAKVKQGDKVKKGQLLIQADLNTLRSAGKETETPVIITNPTSWKPVKIASGEVQAGKDIIYSVEKV